MDEDTPPICEASTGDEDDEEGGAVLLIPSAAAAVLVLCPSATLLICLPVPLKHCISPSFHTVARAALAASTCSVTPSELISAKQQSSAARVARSTSVFFLSMRSVMERMGMD